MVTALAVSAGIHGKAAVLAAAVLVGQLSVGWSNDAIDARLDTAAGRRDKPIATGSVGRATVAWAAAIALAADIPLSLSLGWRPGLCHLLAVGLAWSYNLGLKRGPASPLPYTGAFGLVPVVVAAMLPGSPSATPALVAGAACCGIAAHFANTVGDTVEDAMTGVRGLPQRVGPATSTAVAGGFVAVAAVLVLVAAGATPLTVTAVAVDTTIAAGLPFAVRRTSRRGTAFRLVIVAVALLVVAFVVSGGSHLTRT
jgi:4-hydroxybenzoate polyprenyltransferase